MNKEKNKPDFIIIGSMKCGTTTLYSDLSQMQSLYMPSEKEPAILTKFSDQDKIISEYSRHFKGAADNQLCGEASTDYTKLPVFEGVIDRAYQLCGSNLKLIMIMRDPIERIYSHLRHDIAGGLISADEIDQVVLENAEYIAISDYAKQLRPWVDRFGVENLLCVSFSDLKKNRIEVINEVGNFLGVDVDWSIDVKEVQNKGTELRRTGKFASVVVNSPVYRRYVRPFISDSVRVRLRKIVLRKVTVPDIKLSEYTEEILRQQLLGVELDVESLIGKRIKINEFKKN